MEDVQRSSESRCKKEELLRSRRRAVGSLSVSRRVRKRRSGFALIFLCFAVHDKPAVRKPPPNRKFPVDQTGKEHSRTHSLWAGITSNFDVAVVSGIPINSMVCEYA